jgi:hypothetical protein
MPNLKKQNYSCSTDPKRFEQIFSTHPPAVKGSANEKSPSDKNQKKDCPSRNDQANCTKILVVQFSIAFVSS